MRRYRPRSRVTRTLRGSIGQDRMASSFFFPSDMTSSPSQRGRHTLQGFARAGAPIDEGSRSVARLESQFRADGLHKLCSWVERAAFAILGSAFGAVSRHGECREAGRPKAPQSGRVPPRRNWRRELSVHRRQDFPDPGMRGLQRFPRITFVPWAGYRLRLVSLPVESLKNDRPALASVQSCRC